MRAGILIIHLMEFVFDVYLLQIREGRYFAHEQPKNASSWDLDCVKLFILERAVILTQMVQHV